MERKNAWAAYAEDDSRVEAFAKAYCDFINNGKTERECVAYGEKLAKAHGFEDLNAVIRSGRKLEAGARVYANWMGKSFMLFVLGVKPLEEGMNILGAHIDSPRIDVKQNPLYEDGDLAYLDTHYYGGIKKYQWVAMPLALHGVIIKKNGEKVPVNIGEDENDPVFCISDLLIHLAQEQMAKNAKDVVEGEALNLIVGGRPLAGEEKDAVKANVLKLLDEKYGVEEEDFLSAELEIVPAGKARDMGFDRSMILGYGHDDRVCAYPSMLAQIDVANVERTSITLIVDKEEIGSVGATGMTSRFFENTVAEIMTLAGENSPLALRRALARSRMLSSDVSAGFDPGYAGKFETKNAAFMGRGLCFNKYTGSRGKGGSNDADAEYVALIRDIMDEAGVDFQTCELGRVNAGGGGTIAYIMAKYGMNVIDSGVAVLSMHALWEVANKADIYEAYRGYKAFLERA